MLVKVLFTVASDKADAQHEIKSSVLCNVTDYTHNQSRLYKQRKTPNVDTIMMAN